MAALSCQNFMRILKMFCTRIRIRLFLRMLMIHIRSPPAACWRNRVLLKVSFGLSRTRLSWEVFRNYRLHHHNNSLFKKAIIGIIIWDKIHKKNENMSSSSLILSSEASLFWGESFQRKTSSHHLIPRLISNFQALRLQGTKHDEGHGRRWLCSNPAFGNRDTWYFSFYILFITVRWSRNWTGLT